MKEFLNLEHTADTIIKARVPFNFRYTVKKPSHFPTTLEFYDLKSNCFYRTMRFGRACVGLRMQPLKEEGMDSGVALRIFSNKALGKLDVQKIKTRVSRSYGLEEDVTEFYSTVKDGRVTGAIKRLEGMRNSCIENLYEILNISIILQNANVQRSQKMLRNLLDSLGSRISFDGVMLDVFYTPRDLVAITEGQLRELGLGYRSKYILGLAKLFLERSRFEEEIRNLPNAEIRNTLLKIKGIGPYSANLVLFSYFRDSQFINFDVWNRRILSDFVFGKTVEAKTLEEECDRRWGSFKGYAALYIIEDHFTRNVSGSSQSATRRQCYA